MSKEKISVPCLSAYDSVGGGKTPNVVLPDENRKVFGFQFERACPVEPIQKSVTEQACLKARDACPLDLTLEGDEQTKKLIDFLIKNNQRGLMELLRGAENVFGFIDGLGKIGYYADYAKARQKIEQFILHAQRNKAEQDVCQNCRALILKVLAEMSEGFKEDSLPPLWFGDSFLRSLIVDK